MRIAAIGRSKILWNSIKLLLAKGHEIVLIVTCKAAPEYDIDENDFKKLSREIKSDFLLTQNINNHESIEIVKSVPADIAISVNWINIIGSQVCSTFKYGILNAHAGDLPRYRGNAPVAWAILQGEKQIALTIHQMEPDKLDSGQIVLKEYFQVTDKIYIGDVFKWIETVTPELFYKSVNGMKLGTLSLMPQPDDPNLSLRCYPRKPEDALIDWRLPGEYLARLVRASSEPFIGAFSYWNGKRITIWRAYSASFQCPSLAVPGQVIHRDKKSGSVWIASGDGMLVLQEVETKKNGRCKPLCIINSLRDRLGV